MKHITKELFKNANYRRKFQNMLKEIFTGVPKYSILHKERKKISKPNITQLIMQ